MKMLKFPDGGEELLALWSKFQSLPFGKGLFSKALGWLIPYTGSVSPSVDVLERGHAIVSINDTRSVRNHLASIHAIALANIGEFSTGLALTSQMPSGMRAILGSLKTDYLKKARGHLRAEAKCQSIERAAKAERVVIAEIFDTSGACVSRVTATWVVGEVKR
ncbi:MAG TPA: DUF4442 domain-containing protein [Bdellovibrionota bacterium]|nr:DUF4442 domain-containing protein [Bdellovibrionota bacterium]